MTPPSPRAVDSCSRPSTGSHAHESSRTIDCAPLSRLRLSPTLTRPPRAAARIWWPRQMASTGSPAPTASRSPSARSPIHGCRAASWAPMGPPSTTAPSPHEDACGTGSSHRRTVPQSTSGSHSASLSGGHSGCGWKIVILVIVSFRVVPWSLRRDAPEDGSSAARPMGAPVIAVSAHGCMPGIVGYRRVRLGRRRAAADISHM